MRLLASLHRQDAARPSEPSPLFLHPQLAFQIWRETNVPSSYVSPAQPWLIALLIVTFDLDKGQTIQACQPSSALTAAEQESICNHAMPDSAASGTGQEDALYTFRLPRQSQSSHNLLLAHTLFRQAPDPANPRGFFQKALVLVTSAPCLALPRTILTLLVDSAFVHGETALHNALSDLAAWPDPRVQTVSREISVRFAGELLSVKLPHTFLRSFVAPNVTTVTSSCRRTPLPTSPFYPLTNIATPLHTENIVVAAGAQKPDLVRQWPLCTPLSDVCVAPFHEVNLASALHGVTDCVRTLWELITLGEPVVVLAPTPSQCSSAVLALLGLIHPLPFVGEWRPYLCIQDPMYVQLLNADNVRDVVPNGALFGMTNHHMAQRVQFPHILTIGGTDGVASFDRHGLKTDYRPTLRKLRHIDGALASARENAQTGHAAREAISESLTRPFLTAFERYLEPAWGEGHVITEEPYVSDPFGRPLNVAAWDMDNFPSADDLASGNVISIFRGNKRARQMYQAFVNGPVFEAWWIRQREAVAREYSLLHRTNVIEACVRGAGIVRREDGAYGEDSAEGVSELAQRVQSEIERANDGDMPLRSRLLTLLDTLNCTRGAQTV